MKRGGEAAEQGTPDSYSPVFSTPVVYEDGCVTGGVVIVGHVDGRVCALQLSDGQEVSATAFVVVHESILAALSVLCLLFAFIFWLPC